MPTVAQPDELQFSLTISTDPVLAWHAWTLSDRVTVWFAPEAIVEPKSGGAFELYFIPGNTESMNTRGCRITQFEPPRLLEFTWRGPDQFAGLMNCDDALTRVLVELQPEGSGVRVDVLHSGFGHGPEWQDARQWHQVAWNEALQSLKGALETGDGVLCCAPDGESAPK